MVATIKLKKTVRIKKRFKRNCRICGERFSPTGKFSELCNKCWKKQRGIKGLRVEKRTHNMWEEREKAKAKGIKIHRLCGKWQYIYKADGREVSLVQLMPANLSFKGKLVWELMELKKKDADVERFESKKDAYERIREMLL